MRIMTANLWNIHVSVDSFVEALETHQPDLVAVQELDYVAAEALAELYPHGLVRPGGVPGCALVSREPLTVTVTELPFRPLLTAPVSVGDHSIIVGAIHLANPVAMHDVKYRRHQVRALLENIQGDHPMVLVGDYNSSPAWPAYRMIREHLRDGVKDWAIRTSNRTARTWSYTAGMPKLLRIDHIMVRGVELTGVQVINIAGSDHRALVADLVVGT
jgi:endonuclease/exonuclease/phosphatase (EEP) superfamily protein YafD